MYATRPEGALRQISEVSGAIPGSIKLAAEAPWNAPPYALFVEQLQDARPYQYPDQAISQMGQLEVDTIQKAIQSVALGQADDRRGDDAALRRHRRGPRALGDGRSG